MAGKENAVKTEKQVRRAVKASDKADNTSQSHADSGQQQVAIADGDGTVPSVTVEQKQSEIVTEINKETPPVFSETEIAQPAPTVRYAGFWVRFLAIILDGLLTSLVVTAITQLFNVFQLSMPTNFEFTYFRSFLLTGLYNVLFIGYYGATPGKAIFGLRVVSADGYKPVSYGVAFLREVLGKFISSFCLFIGYLWVAFDQRKQGWHDKIATTVVVYKNSLPKIV